MLRDDRGAAPSSLNACIRSRVSDLSNACCFCDQRLELIMGLPGLQVDKRVHTDRARATSFANLRADGHFVEAERNSLGWKQFWGQHVGEDEREFRASEAGRVR